MMSPNDAKTRYLALGVKIDCARDALTRALDGSTWEAFDNLEMGYAMSQLIHANTYTGEAQRMINQEVAGDFEGAPTTLIVGEPTADGGAVV